MVSHNIKIMQLRRFAEVRIALEECKRKGLELNEDEYALYLAGQYMISLRVAKETIQIIKNKLKIKERENEIQSADAIS